MTIEPSTLIWLAGVGQLGVLVASALVPVRLNWKEELKSLPKLHLQLYLVYGGYVVLGILTLGLTCLTCSAELAKPQPLAIAFSLYGLLFWGIRLSLQTILDAKPHLTRWWLTLGYHLLTVLFTSFTALYGWLLYRALCGT